MSYVSCEGSSYEQYASKKAGAKEFLADLGNFLEAELPARKSVQDKVDEEVKRADKARRKNLDADQDYQSSPEGAFFKLFGIQYVHQFLVERKGLTEGDMPALRCCQSPIGIMTRFRLIHRGAKKSTRLQKKRVKEWNPLLLAGGVAMEVLRYHKVAPISPSAPRVLTAS